MVPLCTKVFVFALSSEPLAGQPPGQSSRLRGHRALTSPAQVDDSQQNENAGESPGVDGIRFRNRKGSPSVGGHIEQPSCLSQRILDLGEVANAHHLENQPIDVGFEFIQGQGTVALPASWLPGDRSRGFLTRSS